MSKSATVLFPYFDTHAFFYCPCKGYGEGNTGGVIGRGNEGTSCWSDTEQVPHCPGIRRWWWCGPSIRPPAPPSYWSGSWPPRSVCNHASQVQFHPTSMTHLMLIRYCAKVTASADPLIVIKRSAFASLSSDLLIRITAPDICLRTPQHGHNHTTRFDSVFNCCFPSIVKQQQLTPWFLFFGFFDVGDVEKTILLKIRCAQFVPYTE